MYKAVLTPLAHWALSRCGKSVLERVPHGVCKTYPREMACLRIPGHEGTCSSKAIA